MSVAGALVVITALAPPEDRKVGAWRLAADRDEPVWGLFQNQKGWELLIGRHHVRRPRGRKAAIGRIRLPKSITTVRRGLQYTISLTCCVVCYSV